MESIFCDRTRQSSVARVGYCCLILCHHRTLGTEVARIQFTEVVREMRKSLLTGYGDEVVESVRKLLAIPTPGHEMLLNTGGVSGLGGNAVGSRV